MDNIEYMAEERNIEMIILLITVLLVSLIGNLLVVVRSVFNKGLQSLTMIFILNLALSDLLSTVRLMLWFFTIVLGLDVGNAACIVAVFFQFAGFYSSIILLALMSIQQYMAVMHSLSVWRKGHGFTIILICVWVLSALAALPAMVHSVTSQFCTISNTDVLVALSYRENIVFVCAFLLMGFCYIRILQTILKSSTNQNKRYRTTGLAFFLVATFFIFWAPYNVTKFLYTLNYYRLWCLNLEHFLHPYYICRLLAFSHCCLNPVIFGLSGIKFHKTERERHASFNSAEIDNQEHNSNKSLNI